MSLKITYPTADTMRIECDGDVVEIPISAVAPKLSVPAEPSPPASEPQPKEDDPTVDNLPPVWTSPIPGPGVAGFITIGSGDADRSNAHLRNWDPILDPRFRISVTDYIGANSFSDFLKYRTGVLNARLGRHSASPVILNLDVGPNPEAPAIDVGELRALVEDPTSGIGGIRLRFIPTKEKL
jgi:hypothetical protein